MLPSLPEKKTPKTRAIMDSVRELHDRFPSAKEYVAVSLSWSFISPSFLFS